MKSYRLILAVLLVLALASCRSMEIPKSITVMNYNVENLFDTTNDPTINDDEFTPQSNKQWNKERYNKKLNDIARVINDIDTIHPAALVGLEEVENKKVLKDLIATSELKGAKYRIVHYDSPDKRGIDVALLYNPKVFKLKKSEKIYVNPGFPTRDILHAQGTIGQEQFHIYINHWPSRIGGEEKTEGYRMAAAQELLKSINSVLAANPQANIIVMGDMNDEPLNKSLITTLGAQDPKTDADLVNLMMPLDKANKGSYNYRGNWNMLDNLIVSKSLLDNNGLKVSNNVGAIFSEDWMIYKNKKDQISPSRTYGGPNYYGGVSDHFPVYFKMTR